MVNIPAASDDSGDAQKSEDQDREATFGEATHALPGRWIVRAVRLRRRLRRKLRRRWGWSRRRRWWWFAVHKVRALPGRAPRFKLSLQEKKAARSRLLTGGVSAMVSAPGGN